MLKKILIFTRYFSIISPLFLAVSCTNIIISKSELSKIESNIFNFIINENEKNLTRFTATLVKKTNNNLTFVSTFHSLNSIKNNIQQQVFDIFLQQFSVKNLETKLKSKIRVEYENKEKDIIVFSLDIKEPLLLRISDSIDFQVLEDFTNTKNSLFSLGFLTILNEDFKPKTLKTLFYVNDKVVELDKENVFVQDINYRQGSSGSPLFYKNKIVGLYRGKKLKNGKLTPFFRLIDLATYQQIKSVASKLKD
ncbi:hypothetical protein [Mesomycoplasma hyopneumoniae]|uniref:Peptidase S7 domain-containing protein n=1 Tax=Mesomycoplasma hyopneumoniae (strain 232) TaxID=295358 RepID=Q600Z1_MESH2|nr:hypothetical protein [Mesomycoplasma hyopneumoniae]AAV27509.1 hypothetical protein mhp312 [Mesomycoplasma hyopneumoniae 232]OWG13920.1 hypothetical protein B5C39_03145 [Mesomycoplasma hyopneumoniae]VEU65289.1 Peptidase S7, Flavivirus NS3 serine protease [Mesomycoplasma hyopneumoniae]